jgi:hypothetical protein
MNKSVPLASFDWDGFLEETFKNLQGLVPVDHLVIRVIEDQVSLSRDDFRSISLEEELSDAGTRLFVPFAVDNLDNAVVLADGTVQLYVDPTVVSPEDEEDVAEAISEVRQTLRAERTETVGYLFSLQDDLLQIVAAWFRDASEDGPAMVEVLVNNEELDLYGFAMERYIEQFELT